MSALGAARRARALPAFLLATTLPLGACTAEDPTPSGRASGLPVSIVDTDGRTVTLAQPATRVVSLVPSATLTLEALGAEEVLVGRTDFDTVSWAHDRPSVGGGLQPSLEAIIAVRPDLVVRFGGGQDATTPARLDDVGIAHIAIRPDRVADVLATISLLGRATGHEAAADSLVAELRAELDALRNSSPESAPRTAYVLSGSPPWVAGPDTYIDELIRLGGGVNVFEDLDVLYAPVSPEQFLAREIEVILTPRAAALDPRLTEGARVVEVSDAVELPGPAVAAAAREIADILRRGGGR